MGVSVSVTWSSLELISTVGNTIRADTKVHIVVDDVVFESSAVSAFVARKCLIGKLNLRSSKAIKKFASTPRLTSYLSSD